jgi:hypothetical protein
MNLFALTGDPARRVLRIPIAPGIQAEIEQLFKQQEAEFNKRAQEEHEFDGKYKPDDDECLFIKGYDDLDKIHGVIANPLSVPEIDAEASEFAAVKAIFTGYTAPDGKRVALIQCFDRKKIITPSGLSLFYSANVYRKVDGIGLTLDSKLSTILIDDTLRFFSFHVLRRIADVSQYFVEATNSDLDDFAACAVIHVEDHDVFIEIADAWIRRKITLVTQSKILDNIDIGKIKATAALFNIDIETKSVGGSDVIVLPSTKAQLKKLLRFLDEDYFQSSLQNLAHMTNSKRLA